MASQPSQTPPQSRSLPLWCPICCERDGWDVKLWHGRQIATCRACGHVVKDEEAEE